MEIRQNIATILRGYKGSHDLTLTEMAEMFGLSRSSLQEYLSGESNPRADTLELLAHKMKLDPSTFWADAFSSAQWQIIDLMYRNLSIFSALTEEKQHRFIDLIMELASLWQDE